AQPGEAIDDVELGGDVVVPDAQRAPQLRERRLLRSGQLVVRDGLEPDAAERVHPRRVAERRIESEVRLELLEQPQLVRRHAAVLDDRARRLEARALELGATRALREPGVVQRGTRFAELAAVQRT